MINMDKYVYCTLDKIISVCEKAKTFIKEKKLPKQCKEDWVKGYKEWKKNK